MKHLARAPVRRRQVEVRKPTRRDWERASSAATAASTEAWDRDYNQAPSDQLFKWHTHASDLYNKAADLAEELGWPDMAAMDREKAVDHANSAQKYRQDQTVQDYAGTGTDTLTVSFQAPVARAYETADRIGQTIEQALGWPDARWRLDRLDNGWVMKYRPFDSRRYSEVERALSRKFGSSISVSHETMRESVDRARVIEQEAPAVVMRESEVVRSPEYAVAKATRDSLEAEVAAKSVQLNAYPKGADGRTPDIVRAMPEWRRDRKAYDTAFRRLQDFNTQFTRVYRKEIQAERDLSRRPSSTVKARHVVGNETYLLHTVDGIDVRVTYEEFAADNRDLDPAELQAVHSLKPGETHHGGGGAQPEWSIRRL